MKKMGKSDLNSRMGCPDLEVDACVPLALLPIFFQQKKTVVLREESLVISKR